ncbi:MAG: hypothetical protein AABZ06_07200 [Bdellovibrionota bacterium]
MKLIKLTLSVMLGVMALVTQNSFADYPNNSSVSAFFTQVEGRWDGRGIISRRNTNGTIFISGYSVTTTVEYMSQQRWQAENIVRPDAGMISVSRTGFYVEDYAFYVNRSGFDEPAAVLFTTSEELRYSISRINSLGQFEELTSEVELKTPEQLVGRNILRVNGLIIVDDSFTLRRR